MFNRNKDNESPINKFSQEAITSIIGEDAIINGELNSNTSIRVDGKVIGNISAQNLIIVGEKAEIKGNLNSASIIVFGTLIGNIEATEIQLKKTGIVNGDISVAIIEIEKGGRYNGNLLMNPEEKVLYKSHAAKEAKISEMIA